MPASRFFTAYDDLTGFIVFVTQLVKRADDVRRLAHKALVDTGYENADAPFPEDRVGEQLRPHVQLIYQTLVSRGVDNYLSYVSDLLFVLFKSRPETLRSGREVRLDMVLAYETREELIEALAEQEVDRLAYAGMRDLAKVLRDTLGFSLFHDEAQLDRAVRIVEDRNLVVHNRAVVNRKYVARVQAPGPPIGRALRLNSEGVFDDLEFLASSVTSIDKRAAKKWRIPRKRTSRPGP